MAFYLMRFEMNWADEFDVASVSLLKPSLVRHFNGLVTEFADEPIDVAFGSNQGWLEPVKVFAEHMKFQRISSEMYNSLKRVGLMQVGPNILEQMMETLIQMKEDKIPVVHETNTDNPIDFPKAKEMTPEEKREAALAAMRNLK